MRRLAPRTLRWRIALAVTVVAALVAGVVLDLLLHIRRRAGWRPNGSGPSFFLASAILWLAYFGLLEVLDGIRWPAEIWIGTVVLNALGGYALAALPSLSTTTSHARRGAAA